ncbi:MAG: tetratricopeptide repeat protein [Bacteroidota bacterium]|nr:tetratricopeptide repeat protein [Bacteroidota bacterium]
MLIRLNMHDSKNCIIFSILESELDQMREMAASEGLVNESAKNKTIYVQYIQDLYRFFKLNPFRDNFRDVFTLKLDTHNTESFCIMVKDNGVIRNIAEYYFQYDHYQEAIKIYHYLNREGVADVEVFEKSGYCYEKVCNYEAAIKHYKRAELFDSNRIWNLKKIAFCYKKLGQYDNAIKYYKEIATLDTEDFATQVALGNSFLKMRQFKIALEYYYKVEVLAPQNHKVKRPLAWCAFVTGKLSEARRYYNELLSEKENRYDLMNLGHVEWCEGNIEKAVELYKKSINHTEGSLVSFLTGFYDDKKYLIENGVEEKNIPLVIDYLRFDME